MRMSSYAYFEKGTTPFMWIALALGSAVCFGLRGILYHWSSQQPMNRHLMLLGVFSTGALVSLTCSALFRQPWTEGVWHGLLMGTFSFVANTAMYKGFSSGKASPVALLIALPAVPVVFLAYLLWGETLSAGQWIAFFIIVAGVALVRYSGDMSWQRMEGLRWGLVAMFFFAFNDLTNKRATMADAPVFPTLALMFMTGAVLFGAWWLIDRARARRRPGAASAVSEGAPALPGKPWSGRKTYLWGMAVGLTHVSGMILIYKAFGAGVTGLVSAVAALNVVLILLYARLVVKERFRPFELAGIGLSLAGLTVLHVFG